MNDFSAAIRITHVFNFVFLSLLVRSGIEILGGHPKLYWNDHCSPGSEWIRFGRKKLPAHAPWTAEDELQPLSPWVALPGRNNLGLGRHWHFAAVTGWICCGVVYVLVLFTTPEWRRLVPTSWSIFPGAWHALVTYYEVIDLATARCPQVILAHQMNGAALTVEHGAPLRLRVEHQLGYKMAKW